MFAAFAALPAPVRNALVADPAPAGFGLRVFGPDVDVAGGTVDLAVGAVVGFHCGEESALAGVSASFYAAAACWSARSVVLGLRLKDQERLEVESAE